MKIKFENGKILFSLLGFLIFFFVFTYAGFSDYQPMLTSILFLIGITLLLVIIIDTCETTANDRVIFWLSYLVKIGYALYRIMVNYQGSLTSPSLTSDAARFWRQASNLYDGISTSVTTRYPYLLNLEFHIFGKNLLNVFLLNIFLTSIMLVFVLKMLNKEHVFGNQRVIALMVVGFFPYEIIVSASVLRESVYFAFIMISFYSYYLYIRTNKFMMLILSIICMLPIVVLHTGYAPILVVYLIDSLRYDKITRRQDLIKRIVLIGGIIAFVIFVIVTDSSSTGYISRGISGIINRVTGETTGYTGEAGSRYLSGMTINSIPTLILYTPVRWIYFLFSPLPTNWRGVTDIASFLLDSCIHFYALYVSFKAFSYNKALWRSEDYRRYVENKRLLLVGVGMISVVALVFCLNTSTAGTAIRHRAVMIGVEAVLIGVGIQLRKMKKYS